MRKFILDKALKLGSTALRLLLSRKITRRAFLRAGVDMGKWVVISEIIDEAAEYSDWVEENQSAILLTAVIGSYGTSFLRGQAKAASVFFGTQAKFFSKLSVPRLTAAAKTMLRNTVIKAKAGAFSVKFPNGEEIRMSVKNGKVWFHAGEGYIGQTILAAGLGGAALGMSEAEWVASANQIAVVGNALLADNSKMEIEDEFRRESPLNLISQGGRIIERVQRQFPHVSGDEIAAIWSLAISDREDRVDGFWIDSFYSKDEKKLSLVINGTTFQFSEDDDYIMLPVDPQDRGSDDLSENDLEIVALIGMILDASNDEHHVVTYSKAQKKYFSDPVSLGKHAGCIVWDEETQALVFYLEADSMIDSALENLEDEVEDSVAEIAAHKAAIATASAGNKISEVTGLSFGNDDDDKTAPQAPVTARTIKQELAKMGKSTEGL